jgi:hypothetical protein
VGDRKRSQSALKINSSTRAVTPARRRGPRAAGKQPSRASVLRPGR